MKLNNILISIKLKFWENDESLYLLLGQDDKRFRLSSRQLKK